MVLPCCQFKAYAEFMNMDWKLYPGNQRLSSNITGKKFFIIYSYKKSIQNELAITRNLTLSSSIWVKNMKIDKIWLCESVGKLKGIGKHEETKMNEMNIHTIADLQRYV